MNASVFKTADHLPLRSKIPKSAFIFAQPLFVHFFKSLKAHFCISIIPKESNEGVINVFKGHTTSVTTF